MSLYDIFIRPSRRTYREQLINGGETERITQNREQSAVKQAIMTIIRDSETRNMRKKENGQSMTGDTSPCRIKLCGLSRLCDIEAANALRPDYVGFVFAPASRRYVSPETARALKEKLLPEIAAVGVFVDEKPENVAALLHEGVIDLAQLHGHEDEAYLQQLRALTDNQLIRAFRVRKKEDAAAAEESTADYVLLDSGAGTGKTFDWSLVRAVRRPYFLAGGLDPDNVADAVRELTPFAVDVSSGIETDGLKDPEKMAAFVTAVRDVIKDMRS